MTKFMEMEFKAGMAKQKRLQDIQQTYTNAKEAIQQVYVSDINKIRALEIKEEREEVSDE